MSFLDALIVPNASLFHTRLTVTLEIVLHLIGRARPSVRLVRAGIDPWNQGSRKL